MKFVLRLFARISGSSNIGLGERQIPDDRLTETEVADYLAMKVGANRSTSYAALGIATPKMDSGYKIALGLLHWGSTVGGSVPTCCTTTKAATIIDIMNVFGVICVHHSLQKGDGSPKNYDVIAQTSGSKLESGDGVSLAMASRIEAMLPRLESYTDFLAILSTRRGGPVAWDTPPPESKKNGNMY